MGKWLAISTVLLLCGCSSALEDGYVPRKLGDSDAMRRSYYASPFTPESKVVSTDREQEIDSRRPKPGY
ncbi:MAG TPA: hypothetical protein VHS31_12375 [Tepidisphaeraceae bacterium]|nr:hypothetical protein [Tepidisphaeraceae bacterium]